MSNQEACEILVNIVYSLQNNPSTGLITLESVEKTYTEIYGPLWDISYPKSIRQTIVDNPTDFVVRDLPGGKKEVCLGNMSMLNKKSEDPNRITYRGIKPKKQMVSNPKKRRKDSDRRRPGAGGKSLFNLFKKGDSGMDVMKSIKKAPREAGMLNKIHSPSGGAKKNKFEDFNIFEIQRKKREDEKRLEQELEEEVARIERMEAQMKAREDAALRKEEEKVRKREEKARKKEEKRMRKMAKKGSGMDFSIRDDLNVNQRRKGPMSDLRQKEKARKKPKSFFTSRREDFDIFDNIKFSSAVTPMKPKTVVISEPKEVHRVGRVVVDKKGYIFENMTEDMKDMFEKSGISPELIREEKQAKRIYQTLLKKSGSSARNNSRQQFVNFQQKKKKIDMGMGMVLPSDCEEVDVKLDDLSTTKLKKIMAECKNILAIREEVADDEERNECIVCYENYRDILFEPCNHILLCGECSKASRMKICPFCRVDIVAQTKVYF